MRYLLLFITLVSLLYSKQAVFLLDKYDKEIELEAKILSKIANASLDGNIKIFIPNISAQEREIYSKHFELSGDCESANFVYDKIGIADERCGGFGKLFFTNNYRRLVSNRRYFGAFFWNKSRPNIVFVKQRLSQNRIILSNEYEQYIEDMED